MKLANGHELKFGDKVLFRDTYSSELNLLEVGTVMSISNKTICVGFLRGLSDERRDLSLGEVLALVDESMTVPRVSISGWSGHFIFFTDYKKL